MSDGNSGEVGGDDESVDVLRKHDDKWYEHDGDETNYAVILQDGSKKYYKQLSWVEKRLRDEYENQGVISGNTSTPRPDGEEPTEENNDTESTDSENHNSVLSSDMELTRRQTFGLVAVIVGLLGVLAAIPEDMKENARRAAEENSDPTEGETDSKSGDPQTWLENHQQEESEATESYREGSRLIENEDYVRAKPHMEDANSQFRSLFLEASDYDGPIFDDIAQYYNLMSAAAGSAVQACDKAVQNDYDQASQFMETALVQYEEAQEVREKIQSELDN